ncbi:MAG: hypothetical protein IJQ88_02380 [Clostridia bacterium]|jgi:hypothetical protein|nr:hypothetical protein [Clostridia bacterium]
MEEYRKAGSRREEIPVWDETRGKDGKTWYLVEADGLEGYIRSDMLTKQAD